jgi:hypothetical protein
LTKALTNNDCRPLLHGLGGEISLHLALVAAKVREEQKHRPDHAGPERVLLRQVEPEIERLHLAGGARDVQGGSQAHTVRQSENEHDHRGQNAEDHDAHLLDVRPGHGLNAANHCVQDGRHTNRQYGQRQIPAEDDRQDERRRLR